MLFLARDKTKWLFNERANHGKMKKKNGRFHFLNVFDNINFIALVTKFLSKT